MGRPCCCDPAAREGCAYKNIVCYYRTSGAGDWMTQDQYIDYMLERNSDGGFENLSAVKTIATKSDSGSYSMTITPFNYPITNWKGDVYGPSLRGEFINGSWGVNMPLSWKAIFGNNEIVMSKKITHFSEKEFGCNGCLAWENYAFNHDLWDFGGSSSTSCGAEFSDLMFSIKSVVFVTKVIIKGELVYQKASHIPYQVTKKTFYKESEGCNSGGAPFDKPSINNTFYGYIPPPMGIAAARHTVEPNGLTPEEATTFVNRDRQELTAPNHPALVVWEDTNLHRLNYNRYLAETFCVGEDHISIGEYVHFPEDPLDRSIFNRVEVTSTDFKYFNPNVGIGGQTDTNFNTDMWYDGNDKTVGSHTIDPCPNITVGMQVIYGRFNNVYLVKKLGPFTEDGVDYDATKIKIETLPDNPFASSLIVGIEEVEIPITEDEKCWTCGEMGAAGPEADPNDPFAVQTTVKPHILELAEENPCSLIPFKRYDPYIGACTERRTSRSLSDTKYVVYLPGLEGASDRSCYREILEHNFNIRNNWSGTCSADYDPNFLNLPYAYWGSEETHPGSDSQIPFTSGFNSGDPVWSHAGLDEDYIATGYEGYLIHSPFVFYYTDNQIDASLIRPQAVRVKREGKFDGVEPAISALEEIMTDAHEAELDDLKRSRLDRPVGVAVGAVTTAGDPKVGDIVLYDEKEWKIKVVHSDNQGNISLELGLHPIPTEDVLVNFNQVQQIGTKRVMYLTTQIILDFQEKYLNLDPTKYRVSSIVCTDERGEAAIPLTEELEPTIHFLMPDFSFDPNVQVMGGMIVPQLISTPWNAWLAQQFVDLGIFAGDSIYINYLINPQVTDPFFSGDRPFLEALTELQDRLTHKTALFFKDIVIENVAGQEGNPFDDLYSAGQDGPRDYAHLYPWHDVDARYPRVEHNQINFLARHSAVPSVFGTTLERKQTGYLYTENNMVLRFTYERI